ncbi:hypothetical protein G7Y89_g1575 [Cudoniella acicularis]|uniref:Fumarylacetoacetase-like C-terminal domain-containing protein n=1 Tax=Cudoniella acicularis TaxID=354080 RepID=A0A8H4RWS4_9HELO|nr:hypothetical protein G7Y89_g1575 [Cudoniella acicularis]
MAVPSSTTVIVLLLCLPVVTLIVRQQNRNKPKQPPRLSETIPFISNAWQFMTNKRLFITRVREALKTSPIIQCRLGPLNLYHIAGSSNVSAIFRSSFTSDPWILRILEHTAGYAPTDLLKFSEDNSGGATVPRNDTAQQQQKRIWYAMHRMYDEYLVSTHPVASFSTSFQTFFNKQLDTLPVGDWIEEVRILDFLRQNMSTAATRSVLGSRIIDVNPGFIDAFWEYDKVAETLAFGLPTWLNKKGVLARDRLCAMCRKWYEIANQELDWDSVESNQDADWEPVFGLRISRALARWAKSFDFSVESISAVYTLFLFGLHANTIPICTWVMIELIRDPDLFQAIKEEISQADLTDGDDLKSLNYRKLATLPLLNSVYTEILRLHVGVLVTRTSTEPVTIAGYILPKGSIVQAPTEAAHLDETVWGTPTHPASEFWAYRHLKEVETANDAGHVTTKLEFSIAGRTGSFFPYGGGISMCAGRNFAKPEILLAVATLVLRFEIEFVEWLKLDGSPAERPALDDTGYANSVAAPPDRDMKVRWRKVCFDFDSSSSSSPAFTSSVPPCDAIPCYARPCHASSGCPAPETTSSLTDEWQYIQNFNRVIADIEITSATDTDLRSRGRKQVLRPFLMSADNQMDPGDLPVSLPVLTQVEEMVIARDHIQMLLKRVRGHQYYARRRWSYEIRTLKHCEDQFKYGEPIISSSTEDIVELARTSQLKVKVCEGNEPFTAKPTERVETVKTLLRPLDPKDVPIIRCIGLNYKTHSITVNQTNKKHAYNIFRTGHDEDIRIPRIAQEQCDYEGELAIVIGRDAKNVSEADALDFVAGYTAGNDVSARDWQREPGKAGPVPQWCFSKSFDKYAPLGPCLVSTSLLGDADNLSLKTFVNGKMRQEANTSDLCFGVRKLVAFCSQGQTLQRGSLIMTGTPGGVGLFMKPPRFLNNGDEVCVEIGGIGKVCNLMVFE